jgi:hypothetical protein
MRAAAIVVLVLAALARPALAFEEYDGTRATAMGGATRAWAVGDSAPLLNPSGMTLMKSYSVEAAYAYSSRFTGQFLHASVVDSTSTANVSGALYYTYHTANPSGPASGHGHEAGVSLATPLGSYLAIGATAKWFRLSGIDQGPNLASGGVTFDVGATIRPVPTLSLAGVGQNLRNLDAGQAPQTISYGAAFLPIPEMVIALDGVTYLTPDDALRTKGTGVRGGLEFSMAQRVAVRAGGGTDPLAGVGYLSGGLSALSEVGALDVGVRGDLFPMKTGSERNVFVGVSLRLFVPGAVQAAQP